MLTTDEQLDQALAKIKTLEDDAQASAALLSEASTNSERQALQITELQAQCERLNADLVAARKNISALDQKKTNLEKRVTEVSARNADLETKEQDVERRASLRLAELAAATGTQTPAAVSPQGDQQADDLVARFKAITDPKEQTTFWRNLTPQQQAQILAATAS